MPHWQHPREVAWLGDDLLTGSPTGVLLSFHGLGGAPLKLEADPWDRQLADLGALVVMPYYGPWSWMNREARVFVDALISEVYRQYDLDPARVPLVLTGGSMGGCSALLCARYTTHRPVACLADRPVCDLPYHFSERGDLPRTLYHAFGHYPGCWSDLLEEHSPLHQVEALPDIPYRFVHGNADEAVNKAVHSDRLVQVMRARGLHAEYAEVAGMGHGGPVPEEVTAATLAFLARALGSGH